MRTHLNRITEHMPGWPLLILVPFWILLDDPVLWLKTAGWEPWGAVQISLLFGFLLFRSVLTANPAGQVPGGLSGRWLHHSVSICCISIVLLGIIKAHPLMYATGLSVFVVEMMVWQLMMMRRIEQETQIMPARAFLNSRARQWLIRGNYLSIAGLSFVFIWGLSTHGFSSSFSVWQADKSLDVVAMFSAMVSLLNMNALRYLAQLVSQHHHDVD